MSTFADDLPALLQSATDDMIDLRRDFHQHPELSFQESRTTNVVTDRLRTLGWTIERCPTATGAVATLDTGRPGRFVMVRADIDGLPVHEERDLSFKSVNDGVMHACGHDVHTAALLGVADLLAQRREQLSGRFVALFQPAEESLGGADAMIEGGVLNDHPVDVVIGAHVTSLAPVGLIALRDGVMMSDAVSLAIEITGKGGHGAMASRDGNVVLAVSALAERLGSAVDALSCEGTNCACSAGVIQAGTAPNVVPRVARLRGTLRTFTDEQRTTALSNIERLLGELSREFSVQCTLVLDKSTPRVVNNAEVTATFERVASTLSTVGPVLRTPPASPSDDVSEYLNRVPGCYVFIGGALADHTSGMHHSPDFAVDDLATPAVAGALAAVAAELAQPTTAR